MRRRRFSYIEYIFFAFIAIGLLFSIFRNIMQWVIPVIVFGAIFLLYKFPPEKIRRSWRGRHSTKSKKAEKRNKKRARFRVIKGKKSDDEPPRYH